MQRGLEVCSTELREVEKKVIALQASLKQNSSDYFALTEALSFVQEAQKAVSRAQSQITRLGRDTAAT
jgi:hypothetical protein